MAWLLPETLMIKESCILFGQEVQMVTAQLKVVVSDPTFSDNDLHAKNLKNSLIHSEILMVSKYYNLIGWEYLGHNWKTWFFADMVYFAES